METVSTIRLHGVNAHHLELKPGSQPHSWEIWNCHTHQPLGHVTQLPDSPCEVELFYGKGGFMAMLTTLGGLRYFALPGSQLRVLGTSLVLHGEPITGNPNRPSLIKKTVTPQVQSEQAMILGAGLATRFERISGDSTQYSKPAVPLVGNISVIECIANTLAGHGYTRLIVNTHFKPASLKAGLARSKANRIDYIDEAEPSGTAGGLRKMLLSPEIAPFLDLEKPLLVVQGDSVTDADFSALMAAHCANNALVTIGCQTVADKDVDKFGIIVTDASGQDGQSGRINGFQEKPPLSEAKSRLGNTGFYIFSPQAYPIIGDIYREVLSQAQERARLAAQPVPAEVPLDFAQDIFPAILKRGQEEPTLGPFWAQRVEGYWSDIGNPVQYLESVHDVYSGKVDLPLPTEINQYYVDGVVYWEGALAMAQRDQAQLSGNVIVATVFSETTSSKTTP